MKQYTDNWRTWFNTAVYLVKYGEYKNIGRGSFMVQVILLQIFDRGNNTLFGGDPYMTLSGRLYRDRRDNVVARAFNSAANFLFHKNGPGDKAWPGHGRGSTNDRNLSPTGQVFAIAFGVSIYGSILSILILW